MKTPRRPWYGPFNAAFVILFALPGLPGCIDFMGFPGGELYDDPMGSDEPFFDEEENPNACDLEESEPNDMDGDYEYDTIGAILPGQEQVVCGRISSTGVSDTSYTGDMDVAIFELLGNDHVSVDLIWDGGADLDLHLWSFDDSYLESSYDGHPEQISGQLFEDGFALMVVGASGSATDYKVRVQVD